MTIVAKMEDGKIVEIVKVVDTVAFSDEIGWICVCFEFGVIERKKTEFKWVPATTRFIWVMDIIS